MPGHPYLMSFNQKPIIQAPEGTASTAAPQSTIDGADRRGLNDQAPSSAPQDPTNGQDGDGKVDKLLHTLNRERELREQRERETSQLRAQLRELESFVDPKAFEEANRRAELAERERQALAEQLKQREQDQQRKFEAERQQIIAELNKEKQLRQQDAIRVQAKDLFLSADGRTDAAADGTTAFDYFWSQFASRFSRDEYGGIYVIDQDGDPVIDKESGKRIEPVKWLEQLKDDPLHGTHFRSQYGSGGGSRSNRDGRVHAGVDISKLSTEEKFRMAFGRKRSAA